jgi:hypothetical protein
LKKKIATLITAALSFCGKQYQRKAGESAPETLHKDSAQENQLLG